MNLTEKQKKIIVDAVTILLLIGAFGLAYYTGLVGTKSSGEPMLTMKVFSIIAAVGSLIMMCVGGISELVSRVKNNTVTWSFTAFMAVQAVAFVGMCAIVIGLNSGAFARENSWIRGLFLSFVAVQVLGYIQSVIYSNTLEGEVSELEDADDDEYDDDSEEDLDEDDNDDEDVGESED